MLDRPGRDTHREQEITVVFDADTPAHQDALSEVADLGLSTLRSTDDVIDRLRNHYGLDASVDIGFEGLILAAERERYGR